MVGGGTADGRMWSWGGRSYCEPGSGERMDANTLIERGCNVTAQEAARRETFSPGRIQKPGLKVPF